MGSKIVFVLPQLAMGGAELQNIRQINYLHQQGYTVYLILTNNIVDLREGLVIPEEQIFELHFPYNYPSVKSIPSAFKVIRPLTKLLQQLAPHVVIASLPLSQYLLRMVKRFGYSPQKAPFKLVAYHHSMQYEANPLNTLGKRLFNKWNQWLAEQVDDYTLCVSKAVEQNITNHFTLKRPLVLPNSTTTRNIPITAGGQELLAKAWAKKAPLPFTIIIPGRLHPSKGHLFFIQAFQQWIQKHHLQADAIKVVIVGEGYIRKDLDDAIEERDLQAYFHFTGNLDNDLLLSVMKAGDLVVIPSINEGFGIVAIEALMQSCLILCSDAGGLPEVIQDGHNGYTFPKLNTNALLEKLTFLYENRDQTLIDPALLRQSYLERFTLEEQMKKLMVFLEIAEKVES